MTGLELGRKDWLPTPMPALSVFRLGRLVNQSSTDTRYAQSMSEDEAAKVEDVSVWMSRTEIGVVHISP